MSCRSCALFLIAVSGHRTTPAAGAGSSPDARDAAHLIESTQQQEMRIDAYLDSQEAQLEEIREGNANLNVALDQLFQARGADLNVGLSVLHGGSHSIYGHVCVPMVGAGCAGPHEGNHRRRAAHGLQGKFHRATRPKIRKLIPKFG